MIALILNGDRIIGYHPDVDVVARSGIPYIEVETVPTELETLGENEILRYVNGVFVVETITLPPSEVDSLKEGIVFLKQRDARMQDDINAIIEGMTGGV